MHGGCDAVLELDHKMRELANAIQQAEDVGSFVQK